MSSREIADLCEERPCFNLPKRESLILVSGYSVVMRAKIIDRWLELEAQQPAPQFRVPQTMSEAKNKHGYIYFAVCIDERTKNGAIASDYCSRRTHSVSMSFDAGNPAHGFSEPEIFRQPIPSRS